MVKYRGGKKYKTKMMIAGLTVGTAMTVARPALLSKVYAANNSFEWERQEDVDRLGGYYSSAARSANGSHLILGVYEGGEGSSEHSPLYVSSNSGASWQNVALQTDSEIRNMWTSVDVSNNGQVMVAASDWGVDTANFYNTTVGNIFVSQNSGSSWNNITPENTDDWVSVVVSGDGSTIAAVDEDESTLYLTENAGGDWTTVSIPGAGELSSVSISDDGNTILVGGENSSNYYENLFISENGGADWENITPNADDQLDDIRHDLSSDGNKIVVADNGWDGGHNDSVYVSSNAGGAWTKVNADDENDNYWEDAAISDNGAMISVVDSDGRMYTSANFGTNWNEEDPGQEYEDSNSWEDLDFNSDGTKAIATGESNAYITTNASNPSGSTATIANPENGTTITITTPDGTTITCSSAVKESGLSAQDASYQYPLGLVDFCFDTEEESNNVTLTFVTDLKPSEVVIRKYNPTTKAYANVTGASVTQTTFEGKPALQVTYTIVDNGPLDLDPDVGEIADPVGIAVAPSSLANTGESPATYLLVAGALITISVGVVSSRKFAKQSSK